MSACAIATPLRLSALSNATTADVETDMRAVFILML
jgi:hypothetical protein